MDIYVGPERRDDVRRTPDTTALVASIFAILGFTMLLLAFGGALGIDVPGGLADGALGTEFGTWAFLSAVIGTLLGCLVGGLMSSRHGLSSAIGHGLAACSGAIVLGALLGAFGVIGLLGGGIAFSGAEGGAVSEIGWNGWALFVGLLSSYVAGVAGWMAGLALQPRASKEMRIEDRRFVRPEVRTRDARDRPVNF